MVCCEQPDYSERYHDTRVLPDTEVVQSGIVIPEYYQIQRLSRAI